MLLLARALVEPFYPGCSRRPGRANLAVICSVLAVQGRIGVPRTVLVPRPRAVPVHIPLAAPVPRPRAVPVPRAVRDEFSVPCRPYRRCRLGGRRLGLRVGRLY